MSPVSVRAISSRRDRDAFIALPWRIYKNDPAWVPPLIVERRQLMDRERHPFFKHAAGEFFLAERDGEIVGRIAATDDANYNALHGTRVGCFGLFEAIDDQTVADALFAAAMTWLRARALDEVMGPIDYSTNYVCGLLVDGFRFPPTLLTSHNPPYYEQLIARAGFAKVKDFYAWWFDQPDEAAARLRRVVEARRRRGKMGTVQIRRGDLRNLKREAAKMREVYNAAWRNNWGFVPFTEAEFDHMAREMKPLLRPEIAYMAEDGDRPVGFILGAPDINVVFKKLNGRLTRFGIPTGIARLLFEKNRLKRVRLIALGVIDDYRKQGVAEELVLRVIECGMMELGMNGELSMTLEDNHRINRFLEAIGASRYKTYRIFQKRI